ncbi:MAG: M36 family metallopeptidase [Saprospiraceae bacterium]|nr:M36 family metallopeptidase [Saprospiraceae bacterium]
MMVRFLSNLFLLLLPLVLTGQVNEKVWKNYFTEYINQSDFKNDFTEYVITHSHVSSISGASHVYLQQKKNGLLVDNGIMSIHVDKNNNLINIHDQFVKNLQSRILASSNIISVENLLDTVFLQIGWSDPIDWTLISTSEKEERYTVLNADKHFYKDVTGKLKYFQDSTLKVQLVWEIYYESLDGNKAEIIKIDPVSGAILNRVNTVLECNFKPEETNSASGKRTFLPLQKTFMTEVYQYNVFPLKVETPNHGSQINVSNPAEDAASPFNWHDTNGTPGPEHTSTKGNNVEAREDKDGNNATLGQMAEGGSNLIFNFPLLAGVHPHQNQNTAITNLFYWNNIIHDIFYQYGFNESAGNFQTTNYSSQGLGNDHVQADAMDGSGVNNANFNTPVDGTAPRMQMFLWNGTKSLTVHSPSQVAGNYVFEKGNFGAATFTTNGNVVLVNDGSSQPSLGCNTLVNGSLISGNIAMVDRGTCELGTKCLNAQNAGAIAVIVCNNVTGNPTIMPPGANGSSVTIPSIMMRKVDCDAIKIYLTSGVNLTMTIGNPIDGDYDNGIICHEYGHGISIRLTGGAGNSGCLNNQEQMGEGWSDWFGLMLTMEESDIESRARGIGTYALNQPVTGNGIRTYKYSTDLTINPHTYNSIISLAAPHGVGSVWCAMLWEMTWALIREYGYDPDLYNGTGGNNMAMALVTEALKLQPCSPGFVDGRNAILAADNVLFGGENQCLIWKSFAKRGLGFSALQGLTSSKTDGTQAFDMPPSCCKIVSNKNNSGNGSLREALSCAVNGDTIRFLNFIKNDTILLSSALSVDKEVIIQHPESWTLTLLSSGIFPVFEIMETVTLENLNLRAGTGMDGRAIYNNGNLNLKNLYIKDNLLNNSTGSTILNEGNLIFEGPFIIDGP